MAKTKEKPEIITSNLDPKYLVQKSDPLVLMRSVPFSLGELKILDTYISRINAADDTRRTVTFTKEEYEELMSLSCVDYRTLKKHTESMLGKVVTLEMPNKEYLQFLLFEQARYHKDEYGKPIIELTCTSLAKDLFFCIGKYHYFSYALENVTKLTRKASYLLYLYIRSNRYRKEWNISVTELRDKVLDCKGQESYQEYKIFKNRVLEPAVKEINAKTDCKVEYNPVKRGRRVAEICFMYHSQLDDGQLSLEDVPTAPARESSDAEKEKDYGGELANLLGNAACDGEFSPEQVRILQDLVIRAVGSADHLELCNYLLQQVHKMDYYNAKKPIKDKFAYLKKLIENDISS